MADFVNYPQDEFSPEYGGIHWKYRLNNLLEETGVEIIPVGYREGKDTMQVTQENTIIYINQIADEMDCVAVKFDQDPDDVWTWYFREKFGSDEMFTEVTRVVGAWSMQCITMYPLEHVVEQYEDFSATDINEVPDWL